MWTPGPPAWTCAWCTAGPGHPPSPPRPSWRISLDGPRPPPLTLSPWSCIQLCQVGSSGLHTIGHSGSSLYMWSDTWRIFRYWYFKIVHFSDDKKVGEWRNYYTNELVDTTLGDNKFNPSPDFNCATGGWILMGWSQYSCFNPTLLTCACQHPQQMYLQLRGLCIGSFIDRFYIPRKGPHP